MNSNSPTDPEQSGDDFSLSHREGPIDFFRNYRPRNSPEIDELLSEVEADEVMHEVIGRVTRLIREYEVTAARVGVELDEALVQKVLDALKRETSGEPQPLLELPNENPTKQFLTQSLYEEILELPMHSDCPSARNQQTRMTTDAWLACLDHLAGSFELRNQFQS